MMVPFALAAISLGYCATDKVGFFKGSTEIGTTQPGSTTYDAASKTYLLSGGGADIWFGADDFRFTWEKIKGDASISAGTEFQPGKIHHLAKAVLMFRQSLDANAPYADIAIHADGHITIQYRKTVGGDTADVVAPEHNAKRLKITRSGNHYATFTGPDDDHMTEFSSVDIDMKGPVYAGVGVCAHDAAGLATVKFTQVKIGKSH